MQQSDTESESDPRPRLEETNRRMAALLCGTPYDDFTKFLANLFDGFPDLQMPTTLFQVDRASDFKALLETISLSDGTEIILVFSGHGAEDALLGPPEDHAANSVRYTRFYDEEALDLGPSVLVAFCCSSAAKLGEYFRTDDNRAYMGFDAPIGFVTAEGQYLEWWKKILHESTLKIVTTPDTGEIKNFVRNLYSEAYKYFKSPEGQENEWWFWMTLVLRGQLDALKIHGRKPASSV